MRPMMAMLCLLAAVALGCGRMVTLKYEPTNPWKGYGTVTVLPFRYEAAERNRVRPREVETNRASRSDLFLSQEISSFFTGALQRELVHSGYTLEESSPVTISGAIKRFYVDWGSAADRSFELHALYSVQAGDQTVFEWTCSSAQQGPNTLPQDGILIRMGTADCMRRFIQAAQEAKVL
ncbi:MAG TPA: hypothetical protein VJ805_10740 [Nitrospiraceae bacterium]|nr:hypothetical protein [Nitrospiraceae bacterium]